MAEDISSGLLLDQLCSCGTEPVRYMFSAPPQTSVISPGISDATQETRERNAPPNTVFATTLNVTGTVTPAFGVHCDGTLSPFPPQLAPANPVRALNAVSADA